LAILTAGVAGTTDWGRFVSVAFLGLALLLVLRTVDARVQTRLIAAIVVIAALVTSGISVLIGEGEVSNWAVPVVGALLALVAPVAIIRELFRQESVTYQTVLGALCLYLLVGLFFSFLYGAVAAFTDGPFFAEGRTEETIDFLYFSFVTLTTTGYGDLVAVTDLGRMLAVTEALLGQLYLVSVVAVLVANLGRPSIRSVADRDQGTGPGPG
jgi:Ion channel